MILQVNSEKQIKDGSFKLNPIKIVNPKITVSHKKHNVKIKPTKLNIGAISAKKD